MAADDYRDEYFQSPEDLQLKLDAEFPEFVAERLRAELQKSDVTSNTVVAVLGVGALFGFARISQVLKIVEAVLRSFEENDVRAARCETQRKSGADGASCAGDEDGVLN